MNGPLLLLICNRCQPADTTLMMWCCLLQDYYPEHLGCMFMINTPWVFRGFWAVIKGFLHERTLAKIQVSSWFVVCKSGPVAPVAHMLECNSAANLHLLLYCLTGSW